MNKSTSINKINGDSKLNIFVKFIYIILNFFTNNIFSNIKSKDMVLKKFNASISENDLELLTEIGGETASPSRMLSLLFWLKLDWKSIKDQLEEIKMIDFGCGQGYYGIRLNRFCGNLISVYTGLDYKKNDEWDIIKKKNKNFDYYEIDSVNVTSEILDKGNLFISQSAIEHFKEDLVFFRNISDYIKSAKRRIIQIHLFPSSKCLMLNLNHGYRQYTIRSVSKIIPLFKDFSRCTLYGLGGNNCNRLFWNFITKQILLNKKQNRYLHNDQYFDELFRSIKADMKSKDFNPQFFALVIDSFADKDIFNI